MSKQTPKTAPHDIEIEKALLCCIMIDENWMEKLTDFMPKSEYFYSKQHQAIFEAMIGLNNENTKVDLLSLKNSLKQKGKLSDAGGTPYLAEVLDAVPTSANMRHYSEIIENKYLLRSLINISTESIEEAYADETGAKILLDKLGTEIFTLEEKKQRNIPQLLEKSLYEVYDNIQEWAQKKGGVSGVTSGFTDLDEKTAGWHSGNLIVIAARPGIGKTQLALNFALNAARSSEKVPVAIFSLEMGRNELAMRMLSMVSKVSLSKLKTGKLHPNDWTTLGMAMGKLGEVPIYIDDSTSLTALELKTKCRRLKKDKNIGMVIIDYIGLMETDPGVERHEGISKISRAMKGLSKELEIPVMMLSQLNREVDKRSNGRPILSDLRESGAIEQDADLVLFIAKTVLDDKDKEKIEYEKRKGLTDLIIGKQRSGPTGEIRLFFDNSSLNFREVDRTI